MFGHIPWSRDPFQRPDFNHVDFQAYQNYLTPNMSPHKHRARPPARRHAACHRSSFKLEAIEGSEFSDESTTDDHYYLDAESSTDTRPSHPKHLEDDARRPNIKPALHPMRVKIPQQSLGALGLHEDDVLILPPTLTRLKVDIRAHHSTESVRVAVARDVRLRDVVKQILPASLSGEVHVHVKVRGEWQELGLSVKMSDIAEMCRSSTTECREVEVKLVVGSRELDRRGGAPVNVGHGTGMKGAKAWEMEVGIGRQRVWMY